MLLDDFVRPYTFHEVHEISIHATPERIFRALKLLTPQEIPLLGMLMRIRSLPAFLMSGERYRSEDDRPFLEQISDSGFVLLAERENAEVVLGTIGQFWKPAGGFCADISAAEE